MIPGSIGVHGGDEGLVVKFLLPLTLFVAICIATSACTVSRPADGANTSEPQQSIVPSTANVTSTSMTATTSTANTTQVVPGQGLRLAFVGDTGTGGEQQYQVARLIQAEDDKADFAWLVLLGDMIYESGDPTLIHKVVIEPYAGTLDDDTKLAPVLGNHDVIMGKGDEIMATLGARDRWYRIGDDRLLLVVLDSTRPNDSDQLEFLETTLATANSDWLVVALHHPPFSAGSHGSNPTIQEIFVPIFEEYGVDVVLAGHDHDYQRSHPIGGVTYVVSGAGARLRPTGTLSFTAVSSSVAHFVSLDVLPGSLTFEAIAQDGVVDRFELTK